MGELLGLSDTSYNLIGIYQDDRYEFRLAYNWRSEYVSSYRDFITGNPIMQDDIGFLDASFLLMHRSKKRYNGRSLLWFQSVLSKAPYTETALKDKCANYTA